MTEEANYLSRQQPARMLSLSAKTLARYRVYRSVLQQSRCATVITCGTVDGETRGIIYESHKIPLK